jgi:hypothetical protein
MTTRATPPWLAKYDGLINLVAEALVREVQGSISKTTPTNADTLPGANRQGVFFHRDHEKEHEEHEEHNTTDSARGD